MEKTTLTREQLYDLVWSTPMIQLAKKYKISDNGLRKICRRMNIPTPDNGYWLKIKYNKSVTKKKLPTEYSGKGEVTLSEIDFDDNSREISIHQLKKEIEISNQYSLKVPTKLTNPDNLIQDVVDFYKEREFKPNEIPSFLVVRGRCLDIRTTSRNLNRALRIMDTFIKVIKARGHKITLAPGKTEIIILENYTEISIIEKCDIIEPEGKYASRTLIPNGKLAFKADTYYSKEWADNNVKLEEKLSTIIAWLELKAIKINIIWDKNRAEEKAREEIRRKERELQELKKKEIVKFRDLLEKSRRWKETFYFRDYIQTIEENAMKSGTTSNDLKEWLRWAKDKADWYDPLLDKEDPLLGPFKPNLIN
ncbi:MAG: hypothetical protein RBT49_00785 [Bacteroidales bacterium]|jgi:hypothetical protein|nr:hypothetical protein [Bacteroidales bacterium]